MNPELWFHTNLYKKRAHQPWYVKLYKTETDEEKRFFKNWNVKHSHTISGQTSAQLQEYIKKNKDLIKGKIRGLYAVCGNMMQPAGPKQKTDLIDNHIAKICGDINVPSKVFLGRITLGLLDTDSRNMMVGMKMPEYDNLKRAECMAFGKEVFSGTTSGS